MRRNSDSAGSERGARRRSKHSLKAARGAGVAKVWALETLPRLLLVVAVVWLVVLFHSLFAERGEYFAEVAGSSGKAWVRIPGTDAPNPQHTWTTAWDERDLYTGDTLHTEPGSSLDIAFHEGSFVRLNPATQISIADASFDRATGARIRRLALTAGSLAVRSGPAASPASVFEVRTGTGAAGGFDAFFVVWPGRVVVHEGEVTAIAAGRTLVAGPGQAVDFATSKVRAASNDERQQASAAAGKVPAAGTPERVRAQINRYELGLVLAKTAWLPAMFGHQSGDGNPFQGLSILNSTRRGQAMKRMANLHEAMTSQSAPPPSVRLDDFRALGIDEERARLMRLAFWRGQLRAYRLGERGGAFMIVAYANDAQRSKIVCTANGVENAGPTEQE